MQTPNTILAGFSDDLTRVEDAISEETIHILKVDETTSENAGLPKVTTVIYVFSPDTGYSSQMLSWFTWIHHDVKAPNEFVLVLGDMDIEKVVFDFAKDFPKIFIDDLDSFPIIAQ